MQLPTTANRKSLDELRIEFKVPSMTTNERAARVGRTLDPTPNTTTATAMIRVYNLSQATIDRIAGLGRKREFSAAEKLELSCGA